MKIYRVWIQKGKGAEYEDFSGDYAEAKAKQKRRDWMNAGFQSWIEEIG